MSLINVIPNTYSISIPNFQNNFPDNSYSPTTNNVDTAQYNELTEEEQQQVRELSARDREVRAHEMAHVAAGGQYVRGGAHFEYQKSPDGKLYAVGGEVSIDTSKVSGDPEATIRKMQIVRRAALAPAKPSAQDRAVAAQATQNETQARQGLRQQESEEAKDISSDKPNVKNQYTPKITFYSKHGIAVSMNPVFSIPHFDVIA